MTMTDPAVALPSPSAGAGGGSPGATGGSTGGGDPGGGGGRRRSGRRWLWVTAALVVAVVVAPVVLALSPAPTPARKATRPVLPPVKSLIGPNGGELVALLQAGQASTYHARYHVSGDPAQIGGSQDFEVWNAPPRRRADTTRTADGHTYRSESFTDGKTTSLCVQQDSASWSCQAVTGSPGGGADALTTSVVAATSGQPVAVNDTTMSGRKVRCFNIAAPSDTLRICATAAGIAVVIGNSAVSYQLVTLDDKVPGSVFKTPAAVRR